MVEGCRFAWRGKQAGPVGPQCSHRAVQVRFRTVLGRAHRAVQVRFGTVLGRSSCQGSIL